MDIVEVKNLTKRFGSFMAVNDISFSLKEGEILGILGPNGAGKTTTIQMLLGVLTPSSGKISYFGKDFQKNREEILEQINFSSTYTNLPWNLTVRENLHYLSYLYRIDDRKKRLSSIIEIFNLQPIINLSMDALSAGQLTRVNLAKALLNYPKVLLLDEPTASLDPDVASFIRQFLLKERGQFQVSIIITSHNMAEVEELCDRVIFIDKGQMIANDSPTNLAKSIKVAHVELLVETGLSGAKKHLEELSLPFEVDGKYLKIDVKEEEIAEFLKGLAEMKIHYTEISIEKPSLEDYFLQVATAREGGMEKVI